MRFVRLPGFTTTALGADAIEPLRSAEMSRLQCAIGSAIEQIKINSVSRTTRRGRAVCVKRRRWFAGPVLALANRFFALAKSPVRALSDLRQWRQWEVETFERLHGPEFGAFCDGVRGVGADVLPGVNVTELLDAGQLTPAVCESVGRELRRAHSQLCGEPARKWSHGDPHAGNFIYEPAAQRARIIDFEVWHLPEMFAEIRQLDDVLAFLQDLLGRDSETNFLRNAIGFLDGYDRREFESELLNTLARPRGCSGLWWRVRTSFLPTARADERVAALRSALLARAAVE